MQDYIQLYQKYVWFPTYLPPKVEDGHQRLQRGWDGKIRCHNCERLWAESTRALLGPTDGGGSLFQGQV